MITSILLLLAGVALAVLGGSLFVKGSIGLAHWARWPTAVIGVTVAAFGTSSPELMVAIRAGLDGVPNISLGNVLGSNVINVGLVLGLVLALAGMRTGEDGGQRRDWAVAVLIPCLMALLLWDGWFSRMDALILLGGFIVWLILVLSHALGHAASAEEITRTQPRPTLLKVLLALVGGLAALIAASELVVSGGKGVAEALGWSPFIVGAVVVALATTTPELSITLISRYRGQHDIGLGNILGSNIFNACVVAAIAALIHPYAVNVREVLPSLAVGVATVLLIFPPRSGFLRRWHGFVLLGLYAVYLAMTLSTGDASH
jgi:cation:H+ antiporter